MSDKDQSGPLPELSAEQEATVRRLLAGARHEEPLPDHVAERLDRVLADLSQDPIEASPRAVDLAAHRRRRNAGRLLVAAAAVIVGGFVAGQVIDVGDAGDSDSAGGGSTVARDDADSDTAAEAEPSPAPEDHLQDGAAKAVPLELTSANLEKDVQRQLPRLDASANLADSPGALASYDAEFGCAPASPSPYGIGRLYPAYYDGVPTVLAVRPPTAAGQEAQVLECGTGAPLRSVIVPTP